MVDDTIFFSFSLLEKNSRVRFERLTWFEDLVLFVSITCWVIGVSMVMRVSVRLLPDGFWEGSLLVFGSETSLQHSLPETGFPTLAFGTEDNEA